MSRYFRLFPLELGLGLELGRTLLCPSLEPLVWVELREFVPWIKTQDKHTHVNIQEQPSART